MKLLKQPNQNNVNIPVFLAFEVLRRNLVPPFKLYIYLKTHSNGIIKYERKFISTLSRNLKCTRHTLINWFEVLKSTNWIGFDPDNQIYYIRSFEKVCRIEKVRDRRGVIFPIKNFDKFNGFIYALPYAHIRDLNLKRDRGRVASPWGDAVQPARNSLKYLPIRIKTVSIYLSINPSKIYYQRKIAEKFGFLKVRSNYKLIENTSPVYLNQLTDFGEIKILPSVFIKKGHVYKRLPDLIYSPLCFRKR